MPVAQLGTGQVALAVSHFPSGLKAALLSAVSELLPFVQFSIATLLSAFNQEGNSSLSVEGLLSGFCLRLVAFCFKFKVLCTYSVFILLARNFFSMIADQNHLEGNTQA